MNQCCIVFILLVVKTTAIQAQSISSLYAFNQGQRSVSPKATPAKPKAVEAPVYLKIYGFYNLFNPGGELDYIYSQAQSTNPTSFKTNNHSLGAGPRAGIGLGYIVSDFINLGVDAELLFGTDLKSEDNFFSGTSGTTKYVSATNTSLKVLSIIPNITFKALSRPSYYIYNRLGLVGGIVLDHKTTYNQVATPPKGAVTTTVSTADYTKNSLALGYQVALGVQFRLSQKLRGFVEAVAYNQSFKPQEIKSSSTSTTSGVSQTQSATTVYKNEGDYNKTDPSEQPSYNVAINSIGIGAGLMFRF